GTPWHAVRAGYVRRRADDLRYEAVVAGRYAHVIAPDRSGKSSLIAATAARLENNGFHVAVLDLEQLGDREAAPDAGRWYYSVAYRLLRQLRVRFELQTWWQDKSILSNRQRLLEFYSEIILQSLQQRVVVFVDGIQCVEDLPFADQLLASIRSAHNARTTDPDFSRLTFVLLGECDPLNLIDEPELSPFNVTQAIPLDDFRREDLKLFATELNLGADDSQTALDRVYHWTRGQPYLSQKLARAIAREGLSGDIAGHVDRIVMHQLAGRAALHSEPHLSHMHRQIVNDDKQREALLNLYGRLRKGIDVPADLGSRLQRRLMAVGLLRVDDAGELRVRNRIYETVFTARWANENLQNHWRAPAIVVAALVVLTMIPLWYTQWLPRAYVNVLTDLQTELIVAEDAWLNLRSFPGHSDTADNLYRNFLQNRAQLSYDAGEINVIASLAAELPNARAVPQTLLAEFWDRRARVAMADERRDEALLASLESLVLSTSLRRNRAATLVGDDYPALLASLPPGESGRFVFNASNLLVTSVDGSSLSQWSLGAQGLNRSEDWTITALEVTPLVRRVMVDQQGTVRRAGLTLNISHPRLADLRIKVIAPSGRAVEVEIGRERASSNEDLRVPADQLRGLIGESLSGTWSVSLRDEATGVAGHLVGWNLTLNSQGLIEDFQRGIGIPDPVERDTEQFWVSGDGRYAVARATQSDSARLWDLVFAKPVSTLAVSESEQIVGIADDARKLVTATLDTVNVWDTASGKRVATLPVGPASGSSRLTQDGRHLFVQSPGDVETRIEFWDLAEGVRDGELVVAGAPALVALDAGGQRIAVADYDRAVRIWDVASKQLIAQLDLPLQPSEIRLGAGGEVLGAVFGNAGVSLWPVEQAALPLLEKFADGPWQIAFSE
ncbi:MAG: AAA-like domain-containing protein, partial [Woeseiaceae bacterium]